MATQQVKFSEWLGQGFDLFKDNIVPLMLVSLVAQLLTSVSGGILAGPMLAGVALVTLNLVDKKDKADVGTLFEGFNFFLQSFLFVLVWGVIVLVAVLLGMATCGILLPVAIVGALFLAAMLMFAPYLIVDQKMAFWPASMKSMEIVKANLWPLVGYYLVTNVIGSAGSALCGVGVIVTMPIAWCMLAVAYRALTSEAAAPVEIPPVPTLESEAATTVPAEEAAPEEDKPEA